MKAQIVISGQIAGNHRLRSACSTIDSEEYKQMFNGYKLVFPNMETAKKALEDACKWLKEEEPDFYEEGGISLYNNILTYDASRAKLSKHE
ncbi:MAG: hypothetical protein JXR54_11755 [Tannerellaceae bacterium]|nr:hypothetical protein [Tannerellaceae bacterium]